MDSRSMFDEPSSVSGVAGTRQVRSLMDLCQIEVEQAYLDAYLLPV